MTTPMTRRAMMRSLVAAMAALAVPGLLTTRPAAAAEPVRIVPGGVSAMIAEAGRGDDVVTLMPGPAATDAPLLDRTFTVVPDDGKSFTPFTISVVDTIDPHRVSVTRTVTVGDRVDHTETFPLSGYRLLNH